MFKSEYLIASGITAIMTLILAAFVFLKGRPNKLNSLYAFWSLCVGFWSLFLFISILAPSQATAIALCRALHVWAIILPTVYVHFVLLYLEKLDRRRKVMLCLYCITVICLVLNFTPWFISASYRPKFDYYITHPQVLYPIHIMGFMGSITYVYFELIRSRFDKKNSPERKKQIQNFLFATVLGYSGGITNYLINYDLSVFPLYPFGNYTILGYVIVIGFGIVRYKFLDIEVLIKKTLVFTGVLTASMLILSFGSSISQAVLGKMINIDHTVSLAIPSLIIILLYEPAKKILTHVTDRYLFQKTEDFKNILTDLSHTIIAVLDIDKIGGIILHTFENALHLESGAILLKTEDGKAYKILDAFGLEKKLEPIDTGDPLVSYFSDSDKVVNLDLDDNVPDFVKKAMADLRARVMVPLFFQAQLIGILVLGRKKSDQEYTRQEMEYFPAISAQIAVALSNAREIELRKKNQADYYQQSKLAAIGIMASGIAHELKNPLQVIRGCAGLVDSGFKKGFYKTMPYEELSSDASEALKRVFENQPDAVRRGRVRNLLKR